MQGCALGLHGCNAPAAALLKREDVAWRGHARVAEVPVQPRRQWKWKWSRSLRGLETAPGMVGYSRCFLGFRHACIDRAAAVRRFGGLTLCHTVMRAWCETPSGRSSHAARQAVPTHISGCPSRPNVDGMHGCEGQPARPACTPSPVRPHMQQACLAGAVSRRPEG